MHMKDYIAFHLTNIMLLLSFTFLERIASKPKISFFLFFFFFFEVSVLLFNNANVFSLFPLKNSTSYEEGKGKKAFYPALVGSVPMHVAPKVEAEEEPQRAHHKTSK